MNPIRRMSRMPRAAIAALAFGTLATVAVTATPAMAQKRQQQPAAGKAQYSKAFQEAAGPVEQAITAAKTRADVVAATAKLRAAQGAAVASATAELQALLAPEKARLESAWSAATTPDDKAAAGQLALNLGMLAQDPALRRRGISTILESGKATPAAIPAYHFFAGAAAFDMKDYAAARTSLQAAVNAGYTANDVDVILADSYLNDNQIPQGLSLLRQVVDKRRAAGQVPPESWYRRALNVARNAQMLESVGEWGGLFAEAHPTAANWRLAIAVLEQTGKYSDQEALDLRRLMARTNSYESGDDYLRYIDVADARRLPGEVLKVIEAGTASGKLKTDSYLTAARTLASGRVAADRATLPSIERDARVASASGAALNSAGDAFLSYGEAAKAEEFYTLAIAKGGIDAGRALTRLGIAQVDQGKYDAALATFAKVSGARAPIAKIWAGYARQKKRGA